MSAQPRATDDKLDRAVKAAIAAAPPLSPEQREHAARLLTGAVK